MIPKTLLIVLAVFLIATAAVFVITRPQGTETPTPTQTATSSESSVLEDNGEYHEITASYPSEVALVASATPAAKASAEAVIDAWVKETVATFKGNANLDALTEEDIRIQGLDQGRKYALGMEYETHTSPSTVSYVFEIYEDTLGAHPNAYYRSFTFNSTTGSELRIADLFESPSYLQTLSRISRERLIPQIAKVSEIPESELDTEYIESGTEPDPNHFQVFYLTQTELVIIFPPYQVGPWVLGTQTVRIPKAELSGELKAQYR